MRSSDVLKVHLKKFEDICNKTLQNLDNTKILKQ